MDAIILTALMRTIPTVTTVWNTVETGDIHNATRGWHKGVGKTILLH